MNTRTPSNRARAPAPTRAAALESRRVAGRLGGSVIGIALWGLRVGHGRWALAGGLNRPPFGGCGVRLEGGRGTYPPGGGAKACGAGELVKTFFHRARSRTPSRYRRGQPAAYARRSASRRAPGVRADVQMLR